MVVRVNTTVSPEIEKKRVEIPVFGQTDKDRISAVDIPLPYVVGGRGNTYLAGGI